MTETPPNTTLESVAEEGRRLAEEARREQLELRLLGGVGVWCLCPSARVAPLARSYGDADFVGRAADRKGITAFMEEHGYEPEKMFNALHGASRLNFHDPRRDRPVDVLLDRFVMAHDLDLRQSTSPGGLTIGLADLLMTKLQVVSINEKDVRDLAAMLLDHGFGSSEIDLDRIREATHNDWGLEHTIHRTLATLVTMVGDFGLQPDQLERIRARIDELDHALHAAPKGTKWKMRARLGERVRWYEEPEETRT